MNKNHRTKLEHDLRDSVTSWLDDCARAVCAGGSAAGGGRGDVMLEPLVARAIRGGAAAGVGFPRGTRAGTASTDAGKKEEFKRVNYVSSGADRDELCEQVVVWIETLTRQRAGGCIARDQGRSRLDGRWASQCQNGDNNNSINSIY
jgi:hypothetical protein